MSTCNWSTYLTSNQVPRVESFGNLPLYWKMFRNHLVSQKDANNDSSSHEVWKRSHRYHHNTWILQKSRTILNQASAELYSLYNSFGTLANNLNSIRYNFCRYGNDYTFLNKELETHTENNKNKPSRSEETYKRSLGYSKCSHTDYTYHFPVHCIENKFAASNRLLALFKIEIELLRISVISRVYAISLGWTGWFHLESKEVDLLNYGDKSAYNMFAICRSR